MRHRDAFSACHPAVIFFFFVLVLGGSMVLMHPVCLVISLACAAAYYVRLQGRKAWRFFLRAVLPVMLLASLLNPTFSHGGDTVLGTLPGGSPLTLESLLYGLAAGAMLGAVLLWFACYGEVMTSDKFLYLFGRIIPSLALVLCMTLRFIPQFRQQLETVREAQAALGRDTASGPLRQRLKNAITCFSVLISRSMEGAVITADSMKARGYGTRRRTAFSLYRLQKRDILLVVLLAAGGAALLAGGLTGQLNWQYYPALHGALHGRGTLLTEGVYLALCLTPIILDETEDRRWKASVSSI